ncbi:hypothetical protein A3842_02805 [Paenibacillus sp. P3E]|uniref:hypothetical protein n=1 Tax=unclassified Paenibacillus TaxID=185978 RepID=UPI00093EFCE0|nr:MULTISPECIES: hypothetical protein [unclassified Paenibacillus]OKP89281.1 hypothetical protein A3848_16030 [Paenibacillus sp. P32E]OKP91529.1 hypothetical protein A3842_02805 [Paenibacillus sp. P3E]
MIFSGKQAQDRFFNNPIIEHDIHEPIISPELRDVVPALFQKKVLLTSGVPTAGLLKLLLVGCIHDALFLQVCSQSGATRRTTCSVRRK